MLRTFLYIATVFVVLVGFMMTVALLTGSASAARILENTPTRYLFATLSSINLMSLGILVALYIFVPSFKRITWGAFGSVLGLFFYLAISPTFNLLSSKVYFNYGDMILRLEPQQHDGSTALVICAIFLVILFRELKKALV